MMTIVQLWAGSSGAVVVIHLVTALLIDRRIEMGLWEKCALSLFALLGPIGLFLETGLIARVMIDIWTKQKRPTKRNERTSSHRAPWLKPGPDRGHPVRLS